jgi:2-polyprenyl-6-methoxyphenol hydroxylase-like FAD-dependent oxidoreductase
MDEQIPVSDERSALVIGAGIGGLAAALGLRRAGWAVQVLEQAPALGEVGAGWSFAPNAVRAADELGIGRQFRALSAPSHAGTTLLTPSGASLMRFRPGRDEILLANHRADLHRMLLSRLPDGTVRTAARVTAVTPSGTDIAATYATPHGTGQTRAAVVVAADGIHSTVRRQLWPTAPQPVFQRITCWRGVTRPGSVRPVDGFQTWGRGERVGVHPLPGERAYWFLAVRQPHPGVHYRDDLAEVRRRVGRWHDPIPALLDATTPGSVLRHDIYDLDPLPRFTMDRVALLGDAAHAMTPFLAQGASQALEDAVVLAAELAGGGPVTAALDRYDRARRPRTQQIVRMARTDPHYSLSTNTLAYHLLTGITRLAATTAVRRKTGRLWDWMPPRIPTGHPADSPTRAGRQVAGDGRTPLEEKS